MSVKTLTFAALFLGACAAGFKPIPIALDPLNPKVNGSGSDEHDLQSLNDYLRKNPADRDNVQDALLILEAIAADKRGEPERSVKLWFDAIRTAKGTFGEKAFIGWLRAYAKNLGKKMERRELAAQVLSELQGGSAGPWLLDRGLTSEQKIIPFLQSEVPDSIEGEVPIAEVKVDAPGTPGINPADPLMNKLASEVCRVKSQYGSGWDQWRRSLHPDLVKYFNALVAQCSGQTTKAINALADVVPRLAVNSGTAPIALEGYARLIKMRRDLGERESVAPLYLPYMKLWKHPAVNETSLGLSRAAFELRRIDDTLWAARARAGIGDGESAKNFAEEVIEYVESALALSYTLTAEQKNNLTSTVAETYHFLAFRLAVEARDWDKASGIAQLALERHSLPADWRNRIRWSLGLYRYLADDFDQARKIWEELLTDISDEKLRPTLLFWVSQAHQKLGNTSESSFYRKSLFEDYPTSFYSVVALKQTGGEFTEAWKTRFIDVNSLKKSLRDWQKTDLDDLRSDKIRGRLVRRAEIFTYLGMTKFSNYALDELQKTIDLQSGDSRSPVWGLYVSRLFAAGGNWLGAISTTTKLTKDPDFWRKRPEQLLVYFPRPYGTEYQAIGKEKNLSPEMLLAITRQESSFRSDVKSPANAWGLMQLTPPTAKRLLPAAGFADPSSIQIPESLLNPERNIRLGGTFLQELSERYDGNRPQMFAAYNAGTQTVENWIERRLFDDPLLFIELIPYQETRDYVKGAWRNEIVYSFLAGAAPLLPNK